MKKLTSLICLLGLFFTLTGPAAASPPPSIVINGYLLDSPNPPVVIAGRTLVPLAAIFMAMNQPVDWHPQDSTITSGTIWLQIDNPLAKVGENTVALQVPAQIIDDRTYVPLAFIATALGKEVQWDGHQNRIDINDKTDLDFSINTVQCGSVDIVVNGTFTNTGKYEIIRVKHIVVRLILYKATGDYMPIETRFNDLALHLKPGESVDYTLTFPGIPQYAEFTRYDAHIPEWEFVYN